MIVVVIQAIEMYYGYTGSDPQSPLPSPLINIIMATHTLAGALGGYLVARRSGRNLVRVGAITAVLAYIMESVYNLFFGQVVGNIWSLVGLVVGGIMGALLAQYQRGRRQIASQRVEG